MLIVGRLKILGGNSRKWSQKIFQMNLFGARRQFDPVPLPGYVTVSNFAILSDLQWRLKFGDPLSNSLMVPLNTFGTDEATHLKFGRQIVFGKH